MSRETKAIEMTAEAVAVQDLLADYLEANPGTLSARLLAAAVSGAKKTAKAEGWLKAGRSAASHENPGCAFGDVVTVKIARGKLAGELRTGRFISWNGGTGVTKVVEATGKQAIFSGEYHSTER